MPIPNEYGISLPSPTNTYTPPNQLPPSSGFETCPVNDKTCPFCQLGNFEQIYCRAKVAAIVAIGLDFSYLGKEIEDRKTLKFIPAKSTIQIQELPDKTVIHTFGIKKVHRDTQKSLYKDVCYKEKVKVLYDVTSGKRPSENIFDLDLYTPSICPCTVLDSSATYAILTTEIIPKLTPDYTYLQLNNYFALYPLPKQMVLPSCPGKYASHVTDFADKFKVPNRPPPIYTSCPKVESCGKCLMEMPNLQTFCDMNFVIIVEVLSSSILPSDGPSLEITGSPYQPTKLKVTDTNIPSSEYQPITDYSSYQDQCKVISMKLVKDFSRPHYNQAEGGIMYAFTKPSCPCHLFGARGFAVIIAQSIPLRQDSFIEISDGVTVVCLGEQVTIELPKCGQLPYPTPPPYKPLPPSPTPYITPTAAYTPSPVPSPYKPPTPLTSYYPEPPVPIPPPLIKPIAAILPELPIITKPPLPLDCINPYDMTCPICDYNPNLAPEEYCGSSRTLLVRIDGDLRDNGLQFKCFSGSMISTYDITAGGQPQTAILNVMFSIPRLCHCPMLKGYSFALLTIRHPIKITNPLGLQMSNAVSLHVLPVGAVTIPPCGPPQQLYKPRTNNIPEEIMLDSVDNTLDILMRQDSGLSECPVESKSCPSCKEMDDDSLNELACSSDQVIRVSTGTKSEKRSKKQVQRQKVTVIQNMAKNHTVDIIIKPYEEEDSCNLPVKNGTCNSFTMRYYYNKEKELCEKFEYSGCNGNANNFNSIEDCKIRCLETYCKEGSLQIEEEMVGDVMTKSSQSMLNYTIADHCDCPYLQQRNGFAYIAYNLTSNDNASIPQLTENYYIVPLSSNQHEKVFLCTKEESTSAKVEETTSTTELEEMTETTVMTENSLGNMFDYDYSTEGDADKEEVGNSKEVKTEKGAPEENKNDSELEDKSKASKGWINRLG